MGWDLVEWLERCASIPMIMSLNPSGGCEFTFRSDLLLTARGGCTSALLVEFVCLPCYLGNTLCSQRLELPGRAGIGAIQIPKFYAMEGNYVCVRACVCVSVCAHMCVCVLCTSM
jgi:hypothetical protein